MTTDRPCPRCHHRHGAAGNCTAVLGPGRICMCTLNMASFEPPAVCTGCQHPHTGPGGLCVEYLAGGVQCCCTMLHTGRPGCPECQGLGKVVLEEVEGRPYHWRRCWVCRVMPEPRPLPTRQLVWLSCLPAAAIACVGEAITGTLMANGNTPRCDPMLSLTPGAVAAMTDDLAGQYLQRFSPRPTDETPKK